MMTGAITGARGGAEAPTPSAGADQIRSPWRMAGGRFFRNHLAVAGLIVLAILMAACFGSLPWSLARVGPDGAPVSQKGIERYKNQNLDEAKTPPTRQVWMGRDALGQDLRARFFLGGAISLTIGLCSAAIAVLIGTMVGLTAGYIGGRLDAVMMRLVDVLYGLPYILLVVLMRVALVPNLTEGLLWMGTRMNWPIDGVRAGMWANFIVLLVGIGSVSWLTLARVVRGQVMSLREQPYVEAARAMGFGWGRIMGRHILPNLVGTVIVYGTLTVPAAILSESFLSFLGLGIQAPVPSWGNLASDGIEALNPVRVRWWMIVWPCAGLSLALLALNFVGDGVRDAVDPKG